jgi:integrase
MRTRGNVRHLKDSTVKALSAPAEGNTVYYDGGHSKAVKGFGCRVTAGGTRSFILNYRTRTGRERRYTIGKHPEWSTAAAREEAERLKRGIRDGKDPLAELEADRGARTVADLCERYEQDHIPNKRESSQRDDKSMIARDILPALKHKKVAEVTFSDIDALHRKIARGTEKRRKAPYRANRVVSLLSKMFGLAVRWGWRADNPARGVERTPERRRERYLSTAELVKLTKALAEHEDQQAANIVRLLLLTGSRRGEVLSAKWADFDLETGVWTKPGATTKQDTLHRVPLSAPARQLLNELREAAGEDDVYVFPGRDGEGHRADLNKPWPAILKAAKITNFRLHDLRHSYASILASAGLSLPIIGALLGHTQAQTTQRYAHLFDDPLRQATERVGAIVSGKPEAEVVPMKGKGAR